MLPALPAVAALVSRAAELLAAGQLEAGQHEGAEGPADAPEAASGRSRAGAREAAEQAALLPRLEALLALLFRLLSRSAARLALGESGALQAVAALARALESPSVPGGSGGGGPGWSERGVPGGSGRGSGFGGGHNSEAAAFPAAATPELVRVARALLRYAASLSAAPSRRSSFGSGALPPMGGPLPAGYDWS